MSEILVFIYIGLENILTTVKISCASGVDKAFPSKGNMSLSSIL